jgi:dTDP-4-dehydrorhamnose reductase
MATIMVTGASGQLGNELKIVSLDFPGYDFVFTDIETLDITSKEQVNHLISKTGPDWIINCAAYNSVDKAENEFDKALMINGTAVKNITDVINGSHCKFVHISSDYVFDGKSNIPYNEGSLPNPLSAYGRSKFEGEKYAFSHSSSIIIRTSWLYSSFGNNFVKTIIKKAGEKESISVVFDQTGTPTYAADLAETIVKIISGVIRNQTAFIPGIYNYSNEGVCSWFDFATEIVNETGLSCRVDPVLSGDYHSVAQRPYYSVLDKSKIKENYNITIPHWRTSLKRCIRLLS